MKNLLFLALACFPFAANADFSTLVATNVGGTCAFLVPSGSVAQFTFGQAFSGGAVVYLSISNRTAVVASASSGTFAVLPTLVGPVGITLSNSTSAFSYCTIQTYPAIPAPSATPSTSVVIPSDTNGPVNIILESSSDLVNWVGALPGTYGTTYSNRFFRVRASR